MPNQLRRRGLTRRRLRRAVKALSVAILDLVPAVKQTCRHHVEWLEVLMHEPKHLLQVWQDTAGELIDQKGTVGVKY